jgi:tRNA 2-thiocytidine biosynthesis protein TtcA
MNAGRNPELAALEAELGRCLARCCAEHSLIEAGDRVMVCLSGGKDSYTLLTLLERLQRRAPFQFELLAVHLDQGQPGYDGAPLRAYLSQRDTPFRILREDTYRIVVDKVAQDKTYCSMCSRLRRGVLYNAAQELGCTKIALGHHRDDAIETLLLNLIYAGSLAAMPPKLRSRDGRNVVIRPLLYAAEASIARYAELMAFPILPCNLCGSQPQLKRKAMKRLLGELEAMAPNVRSSMLSAMSRIKPAHLLDRELGRALGLDAALDDEADGDGAAPIAQAAPAAGGVPAREGDVRRLPLLR